MSSQLGMEEYREMAFDKLEFEVRKVLNDRQDGIPISVFARHFSRADEQYPSDDKLEKLIIALEQKWARWVKSNLALNSYYHSFYSEPGRHGLPVLMIQIWKKFGA